MVYDEMESDEIFWKSGKHISLEKWCNEIFPHTGEHFQTEGHFFLQKSVLLMESAQREK